MIDFPCGCKFEQKDGQLIFDPDITKIPLNCQATWDLIQEGNTKGVFQLESRLGQTKSKDVKPNSIKELSDLIAIIRPGCLESIVDGKNLTQHYIDRKFGKEETDYFHPGLIPILKETYGILVYQEQALAIAKQLAGYSLQEAEILRKAIGKKIIELMGKIKGEFIQKSVDLGVLKREEAEEIFSWIEKSQRYSFNASHSVSYSFNSYLTAYCKAHFPRSFFTSYLRGADGKPDPDEEIYELVNNAKSMGIRIGAPSILNMNENFELIKDKPTFGLCNIKNVGGSVFKVLKEKISESQIDLKSISWDQFLMRFGKYIKTNSFESMILAGAFDCYKLPRTKMHYDYEIYKQIKDKDKDFLLSCGSKTFREGLGMLYNYVQLNSRKGVNKEKHLLTINSVIQSLDNPSFELKDSASWKAKQEKDLLGAEITCSEVDDYDTALGNCACIDYVNGMNEKFISIVAKIDNISEWPIKSGKNKGQKIAFLKISDSTCSLDGVMMFSDEWSKYKKDLRHGKVYLFRGTRDKLKGSFLIKGIEKLEKVV